MSDGVVGLIAGVIFTAMIGIGLDSCYYKPREIAAVKAERVKFEKEVAKAGYGEYQLDKSTGEIYFAWYGKSEVLHQRYPWLTQEELNLLVYQILEKKTK